VVNALLTVGFSHARYSPLYAPTWPSASRRCETSSLFADTQGGRVGSAKHSLGVIRRKVLGLLIPVKIIAGGTGPLQTQYSACEVAILESILPKVRSCAFPGEFSLNGLERACPGVSRG